MLINIKIDKYLIIINIININIHNKTSIIYLSKSYSALSRTTII